MPTSELRTRIISGTIFGAVVLILTLWSFESFAAMCAVGFVILMKEWWGLTKQRSRWWMLIGILYIGTGIGSLLLWRNLDIDYILMLFALVWGSDIAAYFTGKRFGKRKIAPSISPGKSWEGLAGAAIACAVIGFCFVYYGAEGDEIRTHTFTENSFMAVFRAAFPIAIFCALYAPVGLAGDLFESYLKRKAGVKDSGTLIPGHGGLFDRVDALLACAIFSTLFYLGLIVYAILTNQFHI